MNFKEEFSFGEAIEHMKRGLKVQRKGWNGKRQYIQLADGISYRSPEGDIVNCEHEAIGNKAIAFVGTSGVQMGVACFSGRYVGRGLGDCRIKNFRTGEIKK